MKAKRLLKHVKLSEHMERYPLELSGGEQQRVGIWDLMENACQQLDTTVLVVTHKIPTIFSLPYRHLIIESKGVYEVH